MKEVAGGILLAGSILFILLPFLTVIIGLIISHALNAITPDDVISEGAMTICWVIGFIVSIMIIYFYWWL